MSTTTATPAAQPQPSIAEWSLREQALARFGAFLKVACERGGPLSDWHVVFQFGTVARVRPGAPELGGYPAGRDRGAHRWNGEKGREEEVKVERDNAMTCARQCALPGDVGRAVRCGYELVLKDGYPYPGGEGADRTPVPAEPPKLGGGRGEETLWLLLWPRRSSHVLNLALTKNDGEACVDGGELRRLDLMQPRVIAVIAPTLEVTRVP